jgi:hypothetical protein
VASTAGRRWSDLVRGKAEWHEPSGWKSLLILAVFLLVLGVVVSFIGLTVLAAILVCGAVPIAFVAGYCLRQAVLDRGRLPWLRWLWLRDDPLLNRGESEEPSAGGE